MQVTDFPRLVKSFHLHLLDFEGVRLSPHDEHLVVAGREVVDLLSGLRLLGLALERLRVFVDQTNLKKS